MPREDGRLDDDAERALALVTEGLAGVGAGVDDAVARRLAAFAQMVMRANQVHNLTALRSIDRFVRDGIVDAVSALLTVGDLGGRLFDVGSGSGLPGVPWLIMGSFADGVLIEATRKKQEFLADACRALELPATARWGRAEELGREALRGQADVVTARALAHSAIAVELCGALVRVGGRLVLHKGASARHEAEAAETVARRMGLRREAIVPYGHGAPAHALIVYRKERATPSDRPRPYRRMAREFAHLRVPGEREAEVPRE